MSKGNARTLEYWLKKGYDTNDAERMRLSRMPGTIEYYTIFKGLSEDNAVKAKADFQSRRVNTYDNFIKKYGSIEGEIRWELYKEKQAYSNSFEYKHQRYGWTLEQYNEYNKSRGSCGDKNGNFQSSYYDVWVRKYGKDKADEMNSEVTKRKILLGSMHGNYKRPKRPEELEKMRQSAIDRIIRNGTHINYNPKSISIIDEYGKENGYNFQHAENGGEYQIPVTTFFVDAYDKEKNVVLEYDERQHFNSRKRMNMDKSRQDIIGNILKCKFIRIKYTGEITIINYED